MGTLAEDYSRMFRIRRFEETVLASFSRGIFFGTTHTYLGQEAIAIGVLGHCQEVDVVMSNHRCHGHFLAYGGSMRALAAEMMGKSSGVCKGRGGSQHLKWKNFYSSGILGGTLPLAVGMAFAQRERKQGMVFAFLGDGALGQGVVYESLNMASLWNLPILFVVENNRYAQSTPIRLNLAGDISARFEAFGIHTRTVAGSDVEQIRTAAGELQTQVRETSRPAALICSTYRFGPHSKGDDLRDEKEIQAFRERDPLMLTGANLKPDLRAQIEAEVEQEVAAAFELAEADPLARPNELTPPMEYYP